jgi:hypothetical protein
MDNEPYHDLSHDDACDLLADLYRSANNEVKREFTLPNGRVADLMVMTPERDFLIVEMKTVAKAFYLEDTLRRFDHYAHRLWLGIPHLLLAEAEMLRQPYGFGNPSRRIGILSVEHDALVIYRQADRRAMPIELYKILYALFCAT